MKSAHAERSVVKVVAVSVGKDHYADGNPGAEANLERLMGFAEQALPQRPHIICFPEFATTGWPYPSPEEARATGEAVPGDGPFYRRYLELARRSGAVVCGWLAEKETDEVYHNTSFLVGPDGELIGSYRKVHPTTSEQGQYWYAPGDEIPVFDLGFAQVGISICWDMHFPEHCRSLLLGGAELILHPTVANDRRDICPARCRENSLPMVVCVFQDSSYALDPRGKLIADLDGAGGALLCEIDLADRPRSAKYGIQFDERRMLLARRRPELYAALVDSARVPPWVDVIERAPGERLPAEELRRRFPKLDG